MALLPLMLPGQPLHASWIAIAASGLVCTAVAWVWASRVQRHQNADGKRLDELKALTPDAFEEWVAQRFRERGYRVELAGAQGDHGIDLVISREGELAV